MASHQLKSTCVYFSLSLFISAVENKKIKEGANMYNENDDKQYEREQFHKQRIHDFDELRTRVQTLDKKLKQAQLATDRYYRENPKSFAVVFGTDMINDYLNDIDSLLSQD